VIHQKVFGIPGISPKGIFSGIKPKYNFHPLKGGWGAWEAAFRSSYLDLDDGFIRGAKESKVSMGLNWHPYPKTRLMLNYVHAKMMDRDSPSIDNGRAHIFMSCLLFHF
jgi:phosphate-selective porin OprO/OprP